MKKIFFLICSVLFLFVFNSCREDGEWDNNNGGQFGFTIERDEDFIEKAIGEENQLKFNINPSYDFASIKTSFKFTTNLNGTLKLNGETLIANKEYIFTTKENIFEYNGSVAGTHELKISVKNEKGASKEEEFELKYAVSEFSHTFTGGTADIYQADETVYLMKIVPTAGQPHTGYSIKFNSYSGTIKLNGVNVQTGQFYTLPNIDNFTTTLATNQVGQIALDYTIKNATIQSNYNLQQTVISRKIVIESMNISSLNVLPNTKMSLIGILKKTPATDNQTIKYKTWISASSNNNINGIQNTNNIYTAYALGSNGAFNITFDATQIGTYTYNIQVQDEFGNESEVKRFDITVEDAVTFDGTQSAELLLAYDGKAWIIQKGFNRNLKIKAGGDSQITSIEYLLSYDVTNPLSGTGRISNSYTETVSTNGGVVELSGFFNTNNLNTSTVLSTSSQIINRTLKVKAFSSTGQTKEIVIVPSFNGVVPL